MVKSLLHTNTGRITGMLAMIGVLLGANFAVKYFKNSDSVASESHVIVIAPQADGQGQSTIIFTPQSDQDRAEIVARMLARRPAMSEQARAEIMARFAEKRANMERVFELERRQLNADKHRFEVHGTVDEVFIVVEEMPQIIGGLSSLQQHLRYPEIAKKAGIEGVVMVKFVVDEEGHPTDAEIVRGIGAGCDEAALEALQELRFTPGKQRGQPVKVQFSLPVRFSLNNQ